VRVLANSGTDDKITPALLYKLEDIYNKWQMHQTSRMNIKDNKAAKKQKEMEACDQLCEAGMGNLAASNEDGDLENENNENKEAKPSGRKSVEPLSLGRLLAKCCTRENAWV
jgi:hypothetical protein